MKNSFIKQAIAACATLLVILIIALVDYGICYLMGIPFDGETLAASLSMAAIYASFVLYIEFLGKQ